LLTSQKATEASQIPFMNC